MLYRITNLSLSPHTVISKGQVLTHYYRIMNKNGGYTWIQTCATVVCSVKNADEQNIICVNYIITGRENANMILDQCQLGVIKREPTVYSKNDNEPKSPDGDNSRNPNDSKSSSNIKQSTSDNSSMIRSMSDNSSNNCGNKASERTVQNHDDDSLNPNVSGKRGRKRKVKSEIKDDLPPPESTPPMSLNHTDTSHHPDITVKELESVMSKHLPKSMLQDGTSSTDFSTDSLLRHHGDSNSHFAHQPTSGTTMPATALLRQLYANRESVIRATTRPANYMYNDNSQQQQSLPTPPNDSYDSQYLLNSRKSSEAFGNLVPSYGGYSSMDYNNAMTPPSSVSPRDLSSHKSSGNYEYSNLSATDSRLQYQTSGSDTNSLPHLPLKPQPYAIHQMDPSSYGIDHQSQYFPYHSGFHLYHKNIYTPP